jgi:hypothetical protein
MWRTVRMAAFALSVTLLLSGFALARDDDGRYYRGSGNSSQARQYGYQNGYRDGVNRGREEGRERDRNDGRDADWRQTTRGYQSWMGPVNVYRNSYRDGYHKGFREGYRSNSRGRSGRWGDDRHDGYRNDGYRNDGYYRNDSYNPGWNGGYGYGNRDAYNYGYQDGSSVAREDLAKRKPYNPEPRGRYDDRDHGYRREYGDKHSYRATYSQGYRTGYERTMNRY